MPPRRQQGIVKAPDPPVPSSQQKPLISGEKLRQLYTEMLRLRQQTKQRSRDHKSNHHWKLCEAPIVGCTMDLHAEDSLMVSAEFPSTSNAQRPVLNSRSESIVALAAGAALLHRLQAKGNLVVAFVDRKQIGRSREFLRTAHLKSLPIIYVQLEKALRKAARPIRTSIQIPSIPVDKADVVAIYRVASEAIDKARRGAGPTLIECVPFSLKKSSSVNHHSQDPIRYMEYYLRKKHLWPDEMNRTAGGSGWAGDGRMASSGADEAGQES